MHKRGIVDTIRRFSYMNPSSLSKVLDAFTSSSSHSRRIRKRKREENDIGNATEYDVDVKISHLAIKDASKPAIMEVKCLGCGAECPPDVRPKFHADTGEYIARLKEHCPGRCTVGKKVHFCPGG